MILQCETVAQKLAVVIPLHNEEKFMEPLLGELAQLRSNIPYTLLAILVDDCSSDNTAATIRRMKEPWIEIVSMDRRRGQHRAILAGFQRAISYTDVGFVATMDADLDPHPLRLLDLLPYLKSHDMVIGRRLHRRRSPARWLISALLRILSFILKPNTMIDHGSMFRLYRRSVAEMCVQLGHHGAFVAGLSNLAARAAVEIPIQPENDSAMRRTRYSPARFFDSAVQMLKLTFFHPLGSRIPPPASLQELDSIREKGCQG